MDGVRQEHLQDIQLDVHGGTHHRPRRDHHDHQQACIRAARHDHGREHHHCRRVEGDGEARNRATMRSRPGHRASANGSSTWSSPPFPLKPSWQILVCIRDVTVERFKERISCRVKDQYKDMVEKAIDAVYIIRHGRFLLVNRKFQEMLGYEPGRDHWSRHIRHFLTKESIAALADVSEASDGQHLRARTSKFRHVRKGGMRLFLEISIGRLRIDDDQCYVGVVRDITSKKELFALKTRFLHVASHEIRVPLTVIRGYGRMLARDKECALNESQKECVFEIEKQCEKLLHFSNSLLDFAKIHSDKFTLNRQKVDVAEFIKRIVQEHCR
ncbi:MAG: PAS domain S-box protein [Anaerotruncus sp.]|nr:PAS domain S-box protein [Anaerotruncus sp.]